jgi:hypothetical protein
MSSFLPKHRCTSIRLNNATSQNSEEHFICQFVKTKREHFVSRINQCTLEFEQLTAKRNTSSFQQTKYKEDICSKTQNNCVTEEDGIEMLIHSYNVCTSKQCAPAYLRKRVKKMRNSVPRVPRKIVCISELCIGDITFNLFQTGGWDRSADIVTRLGDRRPKYRCSILDRRKQFSPQRPDQLWNSRRAVSYQMGVGVLSPGVNCLEFEADHSPQSVSRLLPHLPLRLHDVVLN